MSEDKRGPGPGGTELAVSAPRPAPALGRPAAGGVAHPQAEPSWGRVLATTLELWLARQRAARHGRLAALLLALVIAATAVAVPVLAGVFTGTARPAAPAPAPGSASSGSGPARLAAQAAMTARTEAAAWIAGQVSSDAIVGCYPAMCTALQAHGITAARLMPLGPGSAGPPGADVIVTSVAAGRQLATRYAPAVIASFGSGRSLVQVRVIARNGAAAYESALRADLAARLSAGAQLLRNPRIRFGAREAAQIRRGEVDSRLLATLAALSILYRFHVTAFADDSPGAKGLFRAVTMTSGAGKGPAELAAARGTVDAQDPPYRPDLAAVSRAAGRPAALRIEFAAPSPLGLLTTVLAVYLH